MQTLHNIGLIILGILMLFGTMAMSDLFTSAVDKLWKKDED